MNQTINSLEMAAGTLRDLAENIESLPPEFVKAQLLRISGHIEYVGERKKELSTLGRKGGKAKAEKTNEKTKGLAKPLAEPLANPPSHTDRQTDKQTVKTKNHPPKKTGDEPETTEPHGKRIIAWWCELHRDGGYDPPTMSGRDTASAKSAGQAMDKQHVSHEQQRGALENYFNDEFMAERGLNLTHFGANWTKYLAAHRAELSGGAYPKGKRKNGPTNSGDKKVWVPMPKPGET